jgi:hypothetical protein
MADTFIAGSKFYLKLTIGGSPATVVCKTATTISFSNSSTEVRNQCTGDYSARLSGGQKSGTIEFSGDLNKTPTSPNISAWDLAEAVGDVVPAVWGEIESGGEIVQVPVQINSVSITADLETQVSFSATLDFAGTPVFSTVV